MGRLFYNTKTYIMPNNIYLISTLRNGKVKKLYFAHGQTELNGITNALQKRGIDSEVMELTNSIFHNQVFDIDSEIEKRLKLIQKIREMKRNYPDEIHVKCIETGEIAINGAQLAESMGICPSNIHSALTREKPYNGYTFVFTTEPITIRPKENKRKSFWTGGFKVTCQETGVTYDCVRDAARDYGMTMQHVYNSIRSGKPFAGLTFTKAE